MNRDVMEPPRWGSINTCHAGGKGLDGFPKVMKDTKKKKSKENAIHLYSVHIYSTLQCSAVRDMPGGKKTGRRLLPSSWGRVGGKRLRQYGPEQDGEGHIGAEVTGGEQDGEPQVHVTEEDKEKSEEDVEKDEQQRQEEDQAS